MPNSPAFARLLLALLLLAAACQPPRPAILTASPATLRQLEGTWLAAPEENQADTLVYRPNTHRFPSLRGRTGFAIRAYGRFERFDPAPAGGLTSHPGTWTAAGGARLRIHLANGPGPDYTLEILSLNNKVLKLRRVK